MIHRRTFSGVRRPASGVRIRGESCGQTEPRANGLDEDDSLREALSIMLGQGWDQVLVFNADGRETGTITRERIIQEGA